GELAMRTPAPIGKSLVLATAFVAGWTFAGQAAVPSVPSSMHGHGVVGQLHKAKQLLEKADHDYKGHRVKAIEAITQAIHAIQHSTTNKQGSESGKSSSTPAKGGTAGATGGKGAVEKGAEKSGKEPQAESDRQLREAMELLRAAEKHLH